VSDMLRPLPELDLNFVSFDTAHEAVSAVRPAVSPVSDCQPDPLSRLSYAAVIHGQEGDVASHVISSDDSFSSGNENSPGGFRKRHNVSPFRPRVDKKLLQFPKGCDRGVQHGSLSDTTVGSRAFSDRGCATHHGQSDTVSVTQPVSCGRGRGRGVPRGPPADAVVSRPVFRRGFLHGSSSATPPGTVLQPAVQCPVNAATLRGDPWDDTGRRHEMQRMRSDLFHSSRDQPGAEIQMSAAASEAERQFMPLFSAPCEESLSGQSTNIQLPPNNSLSASVSSAASVGTAAVGGDLLSQCHCSKVVQRRQGSRLFSLFEQTADDVESHADARVDADVELIQFEPAARYVVCSLSHGKS